MSTVLRPKGVPIVLDGEERHFLFTLNVIDQLQEHYNCTMMDVFARLANEETVYNTVRYVTYVLLTDEVERAKWKDKNSKLRSVSEKEVGWLVTLDNIREVNRAIVKAYGLSMPEADEDDPNVESEQMNP